MQYLGIDWAYRRAAWCAMDEAGVVTGEGFVPADEDGLAKLVVAVAGDVRVCLEMMSGAVWVRDRLQLAGWEVQIADARKVKQLAPLAAKTDRARGRPDSVAVRRHTRRSQPAVPEDARLLRTQHTRGRTGQRPNDGIDRLPVATPERPTRFVLP